MKRFLVGATALLLTFALSSCGGTEESAVDSGYPISTGAPGEPEAGAGDGSEFPTGGGISADRQVIESAFLMLEVQQLEASIPSVKALVTQHGGYVDSWQQQTNDAGELWQVYATLRLPADSLERSLEDLAAIGTVKSLERSATDVTTQALDLDARIGALEASVQRLLTLIDEVTSASDLLEAEGYLAQRQAELESLKSQRDYLQGAIKYATVTVSVYQQGAAAQDEPSNFWEGLIAGWNGLVVFFGGTLVVLGLVAPWLLILVPIAAVAWIAVRRFRSRRPQAK